MKDLGPSINARGLAKLLSQIKLTVMFLTVFSATVFGQTTEFTYQGSLKKGSAPANGSYDFEFRLFDAARRDADR